MNIHVLFGTESGNSELVASDVFDALAEEHDVELDDLAEIAPADLSPDTLYLIVCSTHGDGEPPQSALPFIERVRREQPSLAGVRYAMFGLGDSTYSTYSQGSEHVDTLLAELGATRVGTYGRHDAASRDDASELATQWAEEVLAAQVVPA